MTLIKATNITWHEGHVTPQERHALLRQKGATLWFTGLSGSGKSTIAFTLEHALVQRGHLAYVLDGDNIRHGLNKNLGFSAANNIAIRAGSGAWVLVLNPDTRVTAGAIDALREALEAKIRKLLEHWDRRLPA